MITTTHFTRIEPNLPWTCSKIIGVVRLAPFWLFTAAKCQSCDCPEAAVWSYRTKQWVKSKTYKGFVVLQCSTRFPRGCCAPRHCRAVHRSCGKEEMCQWSVWVHEGNTKPGWSDLDNEPWAELLQGSVKLSQASRDCVPNRGKDVRNLSMLYVVLGYSKVQGATLVI